MTWWMNAAQYATEVLAVVLIFRLLWLRDRREGVYSVFVAFLAVQLAQTLAFFAYSRWGMDKIDYRVLWICSTAISAIFSLVLVYSLAKAVLAELPGIFRFSRTLLNVVFPAAILIALFTAPGEYWVAHGSKLLDPLDRLLAGCYVADRALSMAAVHVVAVRARRRRDLIAPLATDRD